MTTRHIDTQNIDTAPYKVFTRTVLLNDGMSIDSPYGTVREDNLYFTHDDPETIKRHALPETYHSVRGNTIRKNTMFPINTFTRYYRNKRTGVSYAKQVIIVDLLLFPKARNTF